jgi:hypothetical protein
MRIAKGRPNRPRRHKADRQAICGMSMGGAIGTPLAANHSGFSRRHVESQPLSHDKELEMEGVS